MLMLGLITNSQASFAEQSNSSSASGFPEIIVIDQDNQSLSLSLTGLTIRKKFFLDIYSMAHYIEEIPVAASDDIYSEILQQPSTKQISMVFMRSLTAKQIQQSLMTGLKANCSEKQFQQIQTDIDVFMQAIYEDVDKNDNFVIRWYPDGTMVSLFQGRQISAIKNDVFARTLWSIWFGSESVVDRESLVEQLLTSS